MAWHEPRRTADLRKGRVSLAGARYFVTCAAIRPCTALVRPGCVSGIRSVLERLHADGDMRLLCATTMPDHLHIVFELTERLAVGPVIGKLKAITKPALADVGASWQRGFFDHRLRPDERSDAYARYVFLNPYRQDLIKRDTTWAAWMMGTGVDFDFVHLLDAGGLPPVEWIAAGFEELGIRAEDVGEGECVDDTGSGMRE